MSFCLERPCPEEVSLPTRTQFSLKTKSFALVYPVSAVLADKDVMLCIRPGEHGSTYGGCVFHLF